jgi:methylation protein EvaC
MANAGNCEVCQGVVDEFFDFGMQPISDGFVEPSCIGSEYFYRLAVGKCVGCGTVQLMEAVPRERMFHENYPYLSSGSNGMREHFHAVASEILAVAATRSRDPLVVELGSNDGVMLREIARRGVRHVGVEPCSRVADVARRQGITVLEEFFDHEVAMAILESNGPASTIYSANTVCHIPYINSVLSGVTTLMARDGLFIFEDPYFANIVRDTAFDQIYDEHFFYFTVGAVRGIADRHGLELIDVEPTMVHGGGLRYTLCHRGVYSGRASVGNYIRHENLVHITDDVTLDRFGKAIERNRTDLLDLLSEVLGRRQRVAGYGATAKSSTLLNYCGLEQSTIEFICDNTTAKQGLLTPGTHIPVRPPQELRSAGVDYALLLAWNHAAEIKTRESWFGSEGGKWISYVPRIVVS